MQSSHSLFQNLLRQHHSSKPKTVYPIFLVIHQSRPHINLRLFQSPQAIHLIRVPPNPLQHLFWEPNLRKHLQRSSRQLTKYIFHLIELLDCIFGFLSVVLDDGIFLSFESETLGRGRILWGRGIRNQTHNNLAIDVGTWGDTDQLLKLLIEKLIEIIQEHIGATAARFRIETFGCRSEYY